MAGWSTDDREDIVIDALIEPTPLPANVRGKIKQTSLLGGSAMVALETDELPTATTTTTTNRATSKHVGHLVSGANIPADFVPDVTSLTDSVQTLSSSAHEMIDSINKIVGDPKVTDDIRASLANARQTLENANKVSARLDKLGAASRRPPTALRQQWAKFRSR